MLDSELSRVRQCLWKLLEPNASLVNIAPSPSISGPNSGSTDFLLLSGLNCSEKSQLLSQILLRIVPSLWCQELGSREQKLPREAVPFIPPLYVGCVRGWGECVTLLDRALPCSSWSSGTGV